MYHQPCLLRQLLGRGKVPHSADTATPCTSSHDRNQIIWKERETTNYQYTNTYVLQYTIKCVYGKGHHYYMYNYVHCTTFIYCITENFHLEKTCFFAPSSHGWIFLSYKFLVWNLWRSLLHGRKFIPLNIPVNEARVLGRTKMTTDPSIHIYADGSQTVLEYHRSFHS